MSSSLPMVEALLQEFYQPATPSTRRHDIESELLSFKSQPNAWQICLHAATTLDTNQLVWFFCTSTIEHTITRRWAHLSTDDRKVMRDALWRSYANLPVYGVAKSQRDTFAHLIAQMGKREFPVDHPHYMQHCIALIKSKFILGVNLLRVTSEEVISNREDVTIERKNYFHSCISMCIPEVMDLLTQYLIIAVCYINGKDIRTLPNNPVDFNLVTSLPNDNQLSSSIVELLTCIQHLVSWVQTNLISEYFLMSILDLAQWRPAQQEISLGALTILNELLYLQKSLPHTMLLMNGVNGLLDQHSANKHESEMYVDKFRELLRLYAAKYWSKMIEEDDLLENFLRKLYNCTIEKNGALDFTEKLEIWSPIIKGLTFQSKIERFVDIIRTLGEEIMQRAQFEFNKAELELLETEAVDDNTSSEWQHFITQCMESVGLLAYSQPIAIFTQVFNHWSRLNVFIMALVELADHGDSLELMRKFRSANFCEKLRDFTTVCQAVNRLVPFLDAALVTEVIQNVKFLLQHLISTLKLFTNPKMATLVQRHNLQTDVEYLIAQTLLAIRNAVPTTINFDIVDSNALLGDMFDVTVDVVVQNNFNLSPAGYIAAGDLLVCITTMMRPKFLLDTKSMRKLMEASPRLTHLPKEAIVNIYISIIGYHVLPYTNCNDQQQNYERRLIILGDFVDFIGRNFLELQLIDSSESKVSSVTVGLLGILSAVIEYFTGFGNLIKEMLTKLFKPIMSKAVLIYTEFGMRNNAITMSVAEFNLSLLRSLPNQLGVQYIREMITLFIGVLSKKDQLITCQYAVVEKILQMFQLIVEQPGSISNILLCSILDFSLDQILPLLQQDTKAIDTTDITTMAYNLFDSILNNKWQYFYKSSIHQNGSLHQFSSENLHPEHFMAIMNAYGQILVNGQDPSIVRIVLKSLQKVNDRWRLYQRPMFKENLLASFQRALINALLSGEGHLHFELLANALYSMGQVDAMLLRESFANIGFALNLKIIDEICTASDIPTFSHRLTQLIQDAHCVHLTQQT